MRNCCLTADAITIVLLFSLVDFPSSPSAMMKYRVADDDELSHSPEDHRPEHNGTIPLRFIAFILLETQ